MCFVDNFWKFVEAFGDVHWTPGSLLSEVKWTSYGLQVESGTVTLATEWYFENAPQLPTYMVDIYIFFFLCFSLCQFSHDILVMSRTLRSYCWYEVWTVLASADHIKQFTFGSSLASFIWWSTLWKLPWWVHTVQYDLSQIVLDIGVFKKTFQRHSGRIDLLT